MSIADSKYVGFINNLKVIVIKISYKYYGN